MYLKTWFGKHSCFEEHYYLVQEVELKYIYVNRKHKNVHQS